MPAEKMTYAKLGTILLDAIGAEACESGYQTTDPYWVGRYGLGYGDINADGSLN